MTQYGFLCCGPSRPRHRMRNGSASLNCCYLSIVRSWSSRNLIWMFIRFHKTHINLGGGKYYEHMLVFSNCLRISVIVTLHMHMDTEVLTSCVSSSSSTSSFPTRWGQRPEFLISRMFCPGRPPQFLHIHSDAIHPSPSWSPFGLLSWHYHVNNGSHFVVFFHSLHVSIPE